MAAPVYVVQTHTLCDFRGGLERVEPALAALVATRPARPMFRCLLAHVHARIGRPDDARRTLDELARDDFAALPFDQEWLYGMSLLAETSALLGDTDAAGVLYRRLHPWAALNAVDQIEGIRGSVARYLGILAAVTKQWEAARGHFDDALAMNARMGFLPWHAHTQHDYARLLLAWGRPGDRPRARELADAALATYRRLGIERYPARAGSGPLPG